MTSSLWRHRSRDIISSMPKR